MMASSEGAVSDDTTATKPLILFYNGSVAVFHLPQDKAEDIMKMAAGHDDGEGGRNKGAAAVHGDQLVAKLREEMPIASKRSLQRFFQKRKERTSSSGDGRSNQGWSCDHAADCYQHYEQAGEMPGDATDSRKYAEDPRR